MALQCAYAHRTQAKLRRAANSVRTVVYSAVHYGSSTGIGRCFGEGELYYMKIFEWNYYASFAITQPPAYLTVLISIELR